MLERLAVLLKPVDTMVPEGTMSPTSPLPSCLELVLHLPLHDLNVASCAESRQAPTPSRTDIASSFFIVTSYLESLP